MDTLPYWIDSARLPRFPRLSKNIKVDVLIIGAGMTGITAAYLLKKAGKTVALIERERCVRIDTAHTTAHLTQVMDRRLGDLVKQFGRDHAQAAWDAGRAAIEQIQENVEAEQIQCDFTRAPGYLHAALKGDPAKEAKSLKKEAALANELGFDAAFVDSVPLMSRPGVRYPNQAKFHPRKYLAALLKTLPGDGSFVYENTEAEEFNDDPLSVKANGKTIECGYIVIATHVPLMGNAGMASATLFQSKLAPYTSYAIGAKLPKGSVPEALFWDTSDPYYYLRIDRRRDFDYAIFGGEDHKTGQDQDTEAAYARLEETLRTILPRADVQHRWSGQVVETNDGLPYMGETAERQFAATGYSGNGMTFGTLGGMLARDTVLGRKNPWRELFDVNRKKLKGGTWDYIKENFDYPYYMVRDRLTASEGKSLRSLKRGEGKILKVDGKRVAAHRDDIGRVTQLSPVCTHMGCIVHWNQAESTWDCPCHGSRFHATGEVLAGPAESPLEKHH